MTNITNIDPNTGRPFGDHGTALQAIDFIFSGRDNMSLEEKYFLQAWREGTAYQEWPLFYEWLAEQEAQAPVSFHDQDIEPNTKPGEWFWMTVGNLSLRVAHREDCVEVEIFPLNQEMEDPLDKVKVHFYEAMERHEEEE